ncbi:hypothetical protein KC366_g81 [Hortaea werneckii]|nr:hypothetical protein KC366_g81 [Hortaea werneckii]
MGNPFHKRQRHQRPSVGTKTAMRSIPPGQTARSTSPTRSSSKSSPTRQWYDAAVPILYAYPYLYGGNFDQFVRAVCPSINLHVRKSPLSELVKSLNMSGLVHQGSRIRRTPSQLRRELFPRPLQIPPSTHLRPEPRERKPGLTPALQDSRPPHQPPTPFAWPPGLENLSLSGGIDAHFLHGVVSFPQTLKSLTIEHCPLAKGFALTHLLRTAARTHSTTSSPSSRRSSDSASASTTSHPPSSTRLRLPTPYRPLLLLRPPTRRRRRHPPLPRPPQPPPPRTNQLGQPRRRRQNFAHRPPHRDRRRDRPAAAPSPRRAILTLARGCYGGGRGGPGGRAAGGQ